MLHPYLIPQSTCHVASACLCTLTKPAVLIALWNRTWGICCVYPLSPTPLSQAQGSQGGGGFTAGEPCCEVVRFAPPPWSARVCRLYLLFPWWCADCASSFCMGVRTSSRMCYLRVCSTGPVVKPQQMKRLTVLSFLSQQYFYNLSTSTEMECPITVCLPSQGSNRGANQQPSGYKLYFIIML